MNDKLTIGQAAKITGVPAKTIRFYETINLVPVTERAENGYRRYDSQIIEKLKMIKYARDLGLPIEKVRKLLVGCEHGDCEHAREYVTGEIDVYAIEVNEKIRELNVLKDRLAELKKDLQKNDKKTYCCNILGQLIPKAKGGDKNEYTVLS